MNRTTTHRDYDHDRRHRCHLSGCQWWLSWMFTLTLMLMLMLTSANRDMNMNMHMNMHTNKNATISDRAITITTGNTSSISIQVPQPTVTAVNTSIYFFVLSHNKNKDRRMACRDTWLQTFKKYPPMQLQFHFFVNNVSASQDELRQSLVDEQATFRDLVITPHQNEKDQMVWIAVFNKWIWEVVEWIQTHEKKSYDYYILLHDDNYVCVDHIVHDSQFWPGPLSLISHRYNLGSCSADVAMIIGRELWQKAHNMVVKENDLHLRKMIWDGLINSMHIPEAQGTNFHEPRLNYGAAGSEKNRYNDYKEGWVGIDLMTKQEMSDFCFQSLTVHQAYPPQMLELHRHVATNKTIDSRLYSKPQFVSCPGHSKTLGHHGNHKKNPKR